MEKYSTLHSYNEMVSGLLLLALNLRHFTVSSSFSISSVINQRHGPSFSSRIKQKPLWGIVSSTNDLPDKRECKVDLPSDEEGILDPDKVRELTVPVLKQQLRLRGLPVSGRKPELVDRLLRLTRSVEGENENKRSSDFDFVDMAVYIAEDDKEKDTKATRKVKKVGAKPIPPPAQNAEVWGINARMVDDYEGRQVVVGVVRELLIEFEGSNHTPTKAWVAGTPDALKPFLEGRNVHTSIGTSSPEQHVALLQENRENVTKRSLHPEDNEGLDEGDEIDLYNDVALHRDYSDWGKYTPTGAAVSAQEVKGVLLLADMYGIDYEQTQALAAHIAKDCQPVVVMVPELFWGKSRGADKRNDEWRVSINPLQVSVTIRAAAACLRKTYGVSSIVLWGLGYGGGKALEEAAREGLLDVHDVDGSIAPPPVDPTAVVAWYPTHYTAPHKLFGPKRLFKAATRDKKKMAVMAVFAEHDNLGKATPEDATTLSGLLEQDDRVIDHMVKVFPGQKHGFAHMGLREQTGVERKPNKHNIEENMVLDDDYGVLSSQQSFAEDDAEIARLLSTAFMETYSRVFLPTVGSPICSDDEKWGKSIYVTPLDQERDVRQELLDEAKAFVPGPLEGVRIDPTDPSQEEELVDLLRRMQDSSETGPNKITPDDDLATIYEKLVASDKFQIF